MLSVILGLSVRYQSIFSVVICYSCANFVDFLLLNLLASLHSIILVIQLRSSLFSYFLFSSFFLISRTFITSLPHASTFPTVEIISLFCLLSSRFFFNGNELQASCLLQFMFSVPFCGLPIYFF